jgi:hypothetical protein
LVTDEPPILAEGSEKEIIRFAVFPPSEQVGIAKPVFVLQLSNESMSCPRNKCKYIYQTSPSSQVHFLITLV